MRKSTDLAIEIYIAAFVIFRLLNRLKHCAKTKIYICYVNESSSESLDSKQISETQTKQTTQKNAFCYGVSSHQHVVMVTVYRLPEMVTSNLIEFLHVYDVALPSITEVF